MACVGYIREVPLDRRPHRRGLRPLHPPGERPRPLRRVPRPPEHRAGSVPPNPTPPPRDGWRVNAWVKRGILLGFRLGTLAQVRSRRRSPALQRQVDLPPEDLVAGWRHARGAGGLGGARGGVPRVVGVTCMPPMYVNVGAWVGDGAMIDSHALVGSCAQVGRRCHISAGAQIGGVLEPVGAHSRDRRGRRAGGRQLRGVRGRDREAAGRCWGRASSSRARRPVFDIARGDVIRAGDDGPVIIPEGAVVVPGLADPSAAGSAASGTSRCRPR